MSQTRLSATKPRPGEMRQALTQVQGYWCCEGTKRPLSLVWIMLLWVARLGLFGWQAIVNDLHQ